MTSGTFDTHLCLVSEQAIPNLAPLLDPALKPRRAVFLATPAMMERAGWLATVAMRQGIGAEIRPVPDDLPGFIGSVRTCLAEHPGAALNATGGKKTMSLAAFRLFVEKERPVFYVETDRRVVWLNPVREDEQTLQANISLRDYCHAYGQHITAAHRKIVRHQQKFVDHLLAHRQEFAKYSKLASQWFDGHQKNHPLPAKLTPAQRQFFHVAADMQCLSLKEQGYQTGDSDSIAYLRGRWLEEWIFAELGGTGLFHDLAWGVRFAHMVSGVPNEIDVAGTIGQRLYLIECKAVTDKAGTLAEYAYTLDTIRRTLGLAPRAALVTWRQVPQGGHRQRYKALGIEIFDSGDLPELRQRLTDWINKG